MYGVSAQDLAPDFFDCVMVDEAHYAVASGFGRTIQHFAPKFLAEHGYTFSYKMIFLMGFLECMDAVGDARLEDVMGYYAAFYRERIEHGLPAERSGCPYTLEFLADQKCVKRSMLDNPFEKFERKRFFYHSKDLGVISMNHALKSKLTKQDYAAIRQQMQEDLEAYYRDRVE